MVLQKLHQRQKLISNVRGDQDVQACNLKILFVTSLER